MNTQFIVQVSQGCIKPRWMKRSIVEPQLAVFIPAISSLKHQFSCRCLLEVPQNFMETNNLQKTGHRTSTNSR